MDKEDEAAAEDALPVEPLRALRQTLRKDVSMGEYDPATGLTHIMYQRGRLLFNMGNDANKQIAAAAPTTANGADVAAGVEAEKKSAIEERNASGVAKRSLTSVMGVHLRTGPFTGLSLYPEEAYYLLQRGALVVFKTSPQEAREASEQTTATEMPRTLELLSAAQFVTLLLRHQRVSLACLEAYVFLKENKFHPRRHAVVEQQMHPAPQCTSSSPPLPPIHRITRLQPQHYAPTDGATCRFAYDVWKSTTETVYLPNDDDQAMDSTNDGECNSIATDSAVINSAGGDEKTEAPRATKRKRAKKLVNKRKVKRLQLVFRVVVCRFGSAMPPLSAFLTRHHGEFPDAAGDDARHDGSERAAAVPVKIAVVDDKTVLLFEVGP